MRENDTEVGAAGIDERFVALEMAVKDLAAAMTKKRADTTDSNLAEGLNEKLVLISASRPIRLAFLSSVAFWLIT